MFACAPRARTRHALTSRRPPRIYLSCHFFPQGFAFPENIVRGSLIIANGKLAVLSVSPGELETAPQILLKGLPEDLFGRGADPLVLKVWVRCIRTIRSVHSIALSRGQRASEGEKSEAVWSHSFVQCGAAALSLALSADAVRYCTPPSMASLQENKRILTTPFSLFTLSLSPPPTSPLHATLPTSSLLSAQ